MTGGRIPVGTSSSRQKSVIHPVLPTVSYRPVSDALVGSKAQRPVRRRRNQVFMCPAMKQRRYTSGSCRRIQRRLESEMLPG